MGLELLNIVLRRALKPGHLPNGGGGAAALSAYERRDALQNVVLALRIEQYRVVAVAVGVDPAGGGNEPRGVQRLDGVALNASQSDHLVAFNADGPLVGGLSCAVYYEGVLDQNIEFHQDESDVGVRFAYIALNPLKRS